MKIKGNQGVGIETNRPVGEEMDFGIGDASVIIEILRNRLYSNPKQTLVQEYLCNGRDATREKNGVKTPLKVTLPTNLDPVFKVRDFGVGISPDRIRDVFVLYGKSTKRNTDTQTGGFGIGAKSAWAYTDSFTVVTYIDGVQREYLAHIGDNQNGKLVPLSETPTQEPNGTEIQIGVKKQDIQDFVNASYRATMFWDVRPTFEGITEPEIPAFYKKMNCVMHRDNWAIYKSGDLTRFIDGTNSYNYGRSGGGIVMVVDGIPYKLSNKFQELPNLRKFQEYLHYDMVLTIAVGNGDVEVSASREAISDSEYSQKQINALAEDVLKSIEKQIQAELDKVSTFTDYIAAHKKINATLNNNLPTEKKIGKTKYSIDGRHCLKADIFNHVSITSYALQNIRNNKQQVSSDKAVHLFLSKETKFFYQDNLEEGPNKTRDRIRTYFGGNTEKQVYLIEALAEGSKARFKQLIEEVEATALSTIALPVIEKEKTKRASNKGKVCLHYLTHDTNRSRYYPTVGRTSVHIEVDSIDTTDTHLLIEMKDSKLPDWANNQSFMAFLKFVSTKNYKIIAVSPQVKPKIADLDNIQDCKEFMDNLHTHLPLTTQELNFVRKKAFKGSGDFRKLLPFVNDLEDENIQEILNTQIELDRLTQAQVQEIPERLMEIYKSQIAEIEKEMKKKDALLEKLSKKYPLVGAIVHYSGDDTRRNAVIKDLLKYVNMKYNESND